MISFAMNAILNIALAFLVLQYQTESVNALESGASANRLVRGKDHRLNSVNPSQSTVCLTKGCVKAAADIIRNVDPSVNPCDDFYKFSCGGWLERHTIPEDRIGVSVFTILNGDLLKRLRALIERRNEPNEPKFHTNLKNLYKSCMNLTDIERVGDESLIQALKDLGGWPVSKGTSWNASQFNWLETLTKLRQTGYSHNFLMQISITTDGKNNTRYIIELDQPDLGIDDRSSYIRGFNDSGFKAYYNLMVESAVILGADRSKAQKDMLEALAFETSLANFSQPDEERRNYTLLFNKMTVKGLGQMTPNINWSRLLNSLSNDPIASDEIVLVAASSFLVKLDKLLAETDVRVIANYMMWRVVHQSIPFMGKRWRDSLQEYIRVTTGRDREGPRWKQCIDVFLEPLDIAFAGLYGKKYFNKESKTMVLNTVDYVKKEFLQTLDEIDWMDATTAQRGREKASAIAPYIGYPEELLDDSQIDQFYTNLTFAKTNFLRNIQTFRKWVTGKVFKRLRQPNRRGEWSKHARAAIVNAYYDSTANSVEVPAGILRGSFFGKDRPSYLNFGGIGFVIGHEITHGFDDRGRQFDENGNHNNWWDPVTDQKFRSRTQCIIDQYGNYSVPEIGMRLNGITTQGENIADNGGLKISFKAYQQWVQDHGKERSLPGLNYSPEQLFFISAANVWCAKYRPEVQRAKILTDAHSPPRFRVIGPMSNSEDFAKTFDCPAGSPMNPPKKCHVW